MYVGRRNLSDSTPADAHLLNPHETLIHSQLSIEVRALASMLIDEYQAARLGHYRTNMDLTIH